MPNDLSGDASLVMVTQTPLLDTLSSPEDLRALPLAALPQVAEELRRDTIAAAADTGGHFGAGLGVVELTVALHYAYRTPDDRVIWDVSHQAYPHKILTGRRERMRTIRKRGGLHGFTSRTESRFDPFGAAHSSTSISAALGMAVASVHAKRSRRVVAVIGDGAMSAGMAFEAINNAGALPQVPLTIVLNDNDMSIAPSTGALTTYLKDLKSRRQPLSDAEVTQVLADIARPAASVSSGATWFEQFGLRYVGPLDGHNVTQLATVFQAVRNAPGPVLVHVLTEKGKGHPFVGAHPENYHAVDRFDLATGAMAKATPSAPTFTKVFAAALIEEAKHDPDIFAITAAMPSGTGLDQFAKHFPERFIDVGIAEQHAVTFAAGLAAEGLKPFCAIYSTFLQRAYDQVVHDVALQSLPVRFAIDRAGLVGADGATHAGSFDLAYLGCLPNMVIMAAADEAELKHMIATSASVEDRPSAVRFPRGEGFGVAMPERGEVLPIGKGRVVREGSTIALLSLGARLNECLKAADHLLAQGLSVTVADARFAKPLDTALIDRLVREHEVLLTVEEGSIGGFGAHVLSHLAQAGTLDRGYKVRTLTLPDRFMAHGKPEEQYEEAGLQARHIADAAAALLGRDKRSGAIRIAGRAGAAAFRQWR